MSEVVMPRLSDSMEEGTILEWLVADGAEVAIGEPLAEIETDKANMVYESDAEGIVQHVAKAGETLPVGAPIARILIPGERPANGGAAHVDGGEDGSSPVPSQPGLATAAPTNGPVPEADSPRAKASPLARRMAAEHELALGELAGSGPGGRIVKADIEAALASGSASTEKALLPHPKEQPSAPSPAQAGSRSSLEIGETPSAVASRLPPAGTLPANEKPETAKGAVETVELTKLQQTVSRRMAESKATAPHFYLEAEVEMTRAFEARAQLKAAAGEGEVVPSFNDMAVKACALALREYPRANGAYRDGRWELYSRVNVGIAVAAAEALVVPTIFDADKKGLAQIATEARALAARVRERTITPPELSGATFTVSNLGMYGISNFHAVINPPQAAILAVGEIAERAVIRAGEPVAARLMGVTLACDHRILYGAEAAEFLARVRALLEEPLGLAL
jgi:pyruvate dehydrogenase E2 component (dihydrolipoamide acetyltransferase)